MADDAQNFQDASIQGMLTSDGWKAASERLHVILDRTRVRIYQGEWVTPENLREVAYLQGQENFIRNLLEHPVETLKMGLERESDPQAQKPGVGQEKKRARPPGFGI